MSGAPIPDIMIEQFAKAYTTNGYNGGKAYLAIRPDVSPSAARNTACQWLQRPQVQEKIQQVLQSKTKKINKTSLLNDASRITTKAEQKEHLSVALRGVELQGRLIGAFDQSESDFNQYVTFMQSYTNINTIQVTQKDNKATNSDNKIVNDIIDQIDICEGVGVSHQVGSDSVHPGGRKLDTDTEVDTLPYIDNPQST
jgi:hypothetical protein